MAEFSDSASHNTRPQVKVSNFPFNDLDFTSSSSSCSNVVVGYDLQILTGVAFSANNLQHKVRACMCAFECV
jgi:tectonic-1/3